MNITKRQILILAGFIILLIAIPVTAYLVRQTQIFKSRASFTTALQFVDDTDTNKEITESTSHTVKLKVSRTEVSVSPSPAVSPSPEISPSPSPSSSPNDLQVIIDSDFLVGQTQQGTLDPVTNQATFDLTLKSLPAGVDEQVIPISYKFPNDPSDKVTHVASITLCRSGSANCSTQ